MKKGYFSALLGLFLLTGAVYVQAQSSATRTPGSFTAISVSGSFDVFLEEGTSESVRIENANFDLDQLITEVVNGELRIYEKMPGGWGWGRNAKATLYVTHRSLEKVRMSGSGKIEGRSVLRGNSLEVGNSGSGNVSLQVEMKEHVKASLSGSGNISLGGTALSANLSISGSGNIKAADMATAQSEVSISGSGNIHTHASEKLAGRVSGSGNIFMKGEPAMQDVRISGSGKLRKI